MFDLELLTNTKAALKRLTAAVSYHSGFVTLLQNSASPPWRILMYHHIIAPESSALPLQPGMFVRPETFAQQMEYLAATCSVLPLAELLLQIEAKAQIPPRTVVITFDDGWRDNYEFAYPVLKEHQLPATIFLPTAFIETTALFWTDSLGLQLKALYENTSRWNVPTPQTTNTSNSFVERNLVTQLTHLHDATDESGFLSALEGTISLCKALSPEQRSEILQRIAALANSFTRTSAQRHFLNWDEIREMASQRITFGSHSHAHGFFTEQTDEALRADIEISRKALNDHLSSSSAVFCYPGGEFSENSQHVLAQSGIAHAVTTQRTSDLENKPALLGRIGIHEDVSNTPALFAYRVWG